MASRIRVVNRSRGNLTWALCAECVPIRSACQLHSDFPRKQWPRRNEVYFRMACTSHSAKSRCAVSGILGAFTVCAWCDGGD